MYNKKILNRKGLINIELINISIRLIIRDDIMEKVRDKIFELTEDDWEELYYDPEEILKEYSFDKGVEKGIEQGKKEIAKSMLNDNIPIEVIIKHTNLTLEEVNEIKNK